MLRDPIYAAYAMGLFACFIDGISFAEQPNANSNVSTQTSSDERKAAGEAIFKSAMKAARPVVDLTIEVQVEAYKVKIAAINGALDREVRNLKKSDRLSFAPANPLDASLRRQSSVSATLTLEKNLDTVTKALKDLEGKRELLVQQAAWISLTQRQRVEVLKSGYLNAELTTQLLKIADAKDLDHIPTMTNSIGIIFREIPPGRFERTVNKRGKGFVIISKRFWMAEYEITQEQYKSVTGEAPSEYDGPDANELSTKPLTNDHPVENVSWYDAVRFCKTLSELPAEVAAGNSYRLPTEAEWEYACRAGTTTAFHFADAYKAQGSEANLDWKRYSRNMVSLSHTVGVGKYAPNNFGLFDMHGNVAEWCGDWDREDYFNLAPTTDPSGPTEGTIGRAMSRFRNVPLRPQKEKKVTRGGAFDSKMILETCTSSSRESLEPSIKSSIGIRVVCETGSTSQCSLDQFEQLAFYDQGNPRIPFQSALKAYYVAVTDCKKNAEAEVIAIERKNNKTKDGYGELYNAYTHLAEVNEVMASEYFEAGDLQRERQAYIESARWYEKALEAWKLYQPGGDESQIRIRASSVIQFYIMGEDLANALPRLEKALVAYPTDRWINDLKKDLEELQLKLKK